MKLNQDCVRSTLLFIEDNAEFGSFLRLEDFLESPKLKKYDQNEIKYTLGKLAETDFAHLKVQWQNNTIIYASCGMLTWNGHKFVDTIRDPHVWSTTKAVTHKIASVSISMIENISSQVITNLINDQMKSQGFFK